jgi:hypothetical protein
VHAVYIPEMQVDIESESMRCVTASQRHSCSS